MFWLSHVVRYVQLKRRVHSMGGQPGSRSAPRTISTWIMGIGMVVLAAGFVLYIPIALFGGTALFVAGILLAAFGW